MRTTNSKCVELTASGGVVDAERVQSLHSLHQGAAVGDFGCAGTLIVGSGRVVSCCLSLLIELSGFLTVMRRQLLQFFPRPLFQLVRAHQAVESFPPYFGNQVRLVSGDVSTEVVVARHALFVTSVFIEAGFWRSLYRSEVPCVPLALMHASAADTAIIRVTGSDELVERLLSQLCPVA